MNIFPVMWTPWLILGLRTVTRASIDLSRYLLRLKSILTTRLLARYCIIARVM